MTNDRKQALLKTCDDIDELLLTRKDTLTEAAVKALSEEAERIEAEIYGNKTNGEKMKKKIEIIPMTLRLPRPVWERLKEMADREKRKPGPMAAIIVEDRLNQEAK